MKIFLCDDRSVILKSMLWLLEHCGHNWRSLEITQEIRRKSKKYKSPDNIGMLGKPAKFWEEVIELKEKKTMDDDYKRMVLLDIPKNKVVMFKLIWGGEIANLE